MAAQDFEILDERFRKCINQSARVEKLYEGTQWAEGPAYFAAGRYLVWSDIPNDRIMRFDETSGNVSVFRQPCGVNPVDIPTGTPSIGRGGWSVASTAVDVSAGQNSTVRSRPSPINTTASV
jgi:sugar lactone lactonase YvrE